MNADKNRIQNTRHQILKNKKIRLKKRKQNKPKKLKKKLLRKKIFRKKILFRKKIFKKETKKTQKPTTHNIIQYHNHYHYDPHNHKAPQIITTNNDNNISPQINFISYDEMRDQIIAAFSSQINEIKEMLMIPQSETTHNNPRVSFELSNSYTNTANSHTDTEREHYMNKSYFENHLNLLNDESINNESINNGYNSDEITPSQKLMQQVDKTNEIIPSQKLMQQVDKLILEAENTDDQIMQSDDISQYSKNYPGPETHELFNIANEPYDAGPIEQTLKQLGEKIKACEISAKDNKQVFTKNNKRDSILMSEDYLYDLTLDHDIDAILNDARQDATSYCYNDNAASISQNPLSSENNEFKEVKTEIIPDHHNDFYNYKNSSPNFIEKFKFNNPLITRKTATSSFLSDKDADNRYPFPFAAHLGSTNANNRYQKSINLFDSVDIK